MINLLLKMHLPILKIIYKSYEFTDRLDESICSCSHVSTLANLPQYLDKIFLEANLQMKNVCLCVRKTRLDSHVIHIA